MILIIDNYDSFVFNLARYVVELGHDAKVVRNDEYSVDELERMAPSHLILSPGPCTPNEAGITLNLIEAWLDKIPILGVCLGHQAIAQACGGKVVRARRPKHGKADKLFHDGTGLFEGLPNPYTVGRYHSLIVENDFLPPELQVTAKTAHNEIMAIKHNQHPVYGVQFHPESILTEYGYELLKAFLKN